MENAAQKLQRAKRMILGIGKYDRDVLRSIDEIRLYKIPGDPKGMYRITHIDEDLFLVQQIINANQDFKELRKMCGDFAVDWKRSAFMNPEDSAYVELDLNTIRGAGERSLQKRMKRLQSLSDSGKLYEMDINDILRELNYATE